MDLLRENVGRLYGRYLAAAFGSALISSIYGMVDMAMVGQYQGPEGTAALAVVAPVWNLIYSLGLLTGIGGSVLFAAARGSGVQGKEGEDQYFTAALLASVVLAALCWAVVALFDAPLLRFFGAEDTLLPLAQRYLLPVKFGVPLFLLNQMLSCFLRNDGTPGLATGAVLAGGIFNIFGDYFFVFGLDFGIFGAGLATVLGALITFCVLLSHFFSPRNTLRLVRPTRLAVRLGRIGTAGFAACFVDAAMGILTILFNRQIMTYAGADALSVYGILVNISTFVQCCAYSVGQAAQPILSTNFGAGRWDRIRATLRCSLLATAAFSLFWTAAALGAPLVFVYIFMSPTPQVLAIAPAIIRCYGLSFLLLPFNIFSTYYFQSLLRPLPAMAVSVARGALISGLLILTLPALLGADALWLAMPITELVVALPVAALMLRDTRQGTKKRTLN
ncbi:MATE family efflux transporter [Intestinimonas sp. HCP28S3_D6]|uniref:MATE family efflux transporter n=1 Tax=Intestinimonas sp. HCP28S3_D6 TaxID=3438942 RepID=UPI003F8872E8